MSANRYLTDERLDIQATARRFAMEEVLPLANELDPKKEDIPPSLMSRIAEMGYFGILVDGEYGGMGKGVFEYALIAEELARAWMSVASIIARGNGLGSLILFFVSAIWRSSASLLGLMIVLNPSGFPFDFLPVWVLPTGNCPRVPPAGFEPAYVGLENRSLIRSSHGGKFRTF